MQNNIKITNLYNYGNVTCSNEWVIEPQVYPYHRVYIVYDGDVTYEDDYQKIKLESNHLYLFSSINKYKITHNKSNPLKCLFFHLSFNYIITNNIIISPIVSQDEIYHTIKLLEILVNNCDDGNIENALNILFSRLDKNVFHYVKDERICKVLNYVHDNYSSSLTNLSLSKLINVDKRYYIKIFRDVCGITPKQYIQQYRIFKASQFLKEGYRINEVSSMIGFSDDKAFSRFFKNAKNISPSVFQKSYFLQP